MAVIRLQISLNSLKNLLFCNNDVDDDDSDNIDDDNDDGDDDDVDDDDDGSVTTML